MEQQPGTGATERVIPMDVVVVIPVHRQQREERRPTPEVEAAAEAAETAVVRMAVVETAALVEV